MNSEYVLLMNGDIYSERENVNQSDTQWLMDRLVDCHTIDEILELFRVIKGPYSIIFYDQTAKNLFFLRDSFGRQTLLLGRRHDGAIIVSSVIGIQPPQISLGSLQADFNQNLSFFSFL